MAFPPVEWMSEMEPATLAAPSPYPLDARAEESLMRERDQ